MERDDGCYILEDIIDRLVYFSAPALKGAFSWL
jgi:hypothetical protein